MVSFVSPRSPQPLTVNFMPSLATSFRNAIGFTAGLSVGKSGLTYKQCFRLSHFMLTMKEYILKSGLIDYSWFLSYVNQKLVVNWLRCGKINFLELINISRYATALDIFLSERHLYHILYRKTLIQSLYFRNNNSRIFFLQELSNHSSSLHLQSHSRPTIYFILLFNGMKDLNQNLSKLLFYYLP
jgi:hypothetical protein